MGCPTLGRSVPGARGQWRCHNSSLVQETRPESPLGLDRKGTVSFASRMRGDCVLISRPTHQLLLSPFFREFGGGPALASWPAGCSAKHTEHAGWGAGSASSRPGFWTSVFSSHKGHNDLTTPPSQDCLGPKLNNGREYVVFDLLLHSQFLFTHGHLLNANQGPRALAGLRMEL